MPTYLRQTLMPALSASALPPLGHEYHHITRCSIENICQTIWHNARIYIRARLVLRMHLSIALVNIPHDYIRP